jgi:NAD(P)-dependent dehydrogenase (short-subunit alcohol dehydrogenase family)
MFPNFNLDNRVALLTGAGRGIGRGIAQALASAGCAVAIQDIDEDVAQEVARGIEAKGGCAIALGGDITDLDLPAQLVAQTREQLGGLHIVVNNAAIQIEKSWLELSREEIEMQIRADQITPMMLCQLAAPIFREQGWGRVLNVGSIQGLKGNPGMLAYSISKAALENMTRALARDLAPHGITVNIISPGYFDTYRNRSQFPNEEEKKKRGEWLPMKRVGDPEDCGGIALLLCSDAGSYITGQTIYVDGGISVR